MATIKQINVGGTSYDIKATYDGSGNTITSYYVKKSGDTMTGTLTVPGAYITQTAFLRQGSTVFTCGGTSGTAGYFHFATVKVTGTYANHPIHFMIAQRGIMPVDVYFRFENANNTDPPLQSFLATTRLNYYAYKSATGTWELYAQKTESYDHLEILQYNKD